MSLRVRCDLKRAPMRSASRARTIWPGVVPVARVLRARVAQSDDDPAVVRHMRSLSMPTGRAVHARPAVSAWSLLGLGLSRGGGLGGAALSRLALGRGSRRGRRPARLITCRTRASGSVTSVVPDGSAMSLAWTTVPTSAPSTSTSTPSGRCVASASTAICTSCWSSIPPENTSPDTRTGISTVTFSPLRTSIRSTCSMEPWMASRCTAFGRASSARFSRPSMLISTLGVFSAIMSWCPGSVKWRFGAPWPYMTPGTRPSRRVRRAAPLPNSVRGSASIRTSGTVSHSSLGTCSYLPGRPPYPRCPTDGKPRRRFKREETPAKSSRQTARVRLRTFRSRTRSSSATQQPGTTLSRFPRGLRSTPGR